MSAARILATLLAAAQGTGCATFELGDGTQKLHIDSRPPGAVALILPDEIFVETPAEIRLGRRRARTLRIELPGYCRETVYLDRLTNPSRDLNWFLLIFAPLGIWWDTASGAAYRLSPDHAEVTLWPDDSRERECGPAGAVRRRQPLEPL